MADWMSYWPLMAALICVGAAAGLSAGLFGIGGGAVMVPVLFYTFLSLGVPETVVMHCAVATSSAVIIPNAIRSVRSHNRHHAVDWDLLWPKNPLASYAFWIGLGSFFAAIWLAPRMSGQVLTILFACIASVVALKFIFRQPDWKFRDTVPGGISRPFVGGSVGVLSSLMGIGGGSLTVPLMNMCGVPIHRAVGTASGFGLAIALPATLGFIISGLNVPERPPLSMGYVNVLGFIIIASVAFLTIPIGAKLAHGLSQSRLKMIFGIALLLVAGNMAREVLV